MTAALPPFCWTRNSLPSRSVIFLPEGSPRYVLSARSASVEKELRCFRQDDEVLVAIERLKQGEELTKMYPPRRSHCGV